MSAADASTRVSGFRAAASSNAIPSALPPPIPATHANVRLTGPNVEIRYLYVPTTTPADVLDGSRSRTSSSVLNARFAIGKADITLPSTDAVYEAWSP